MAVLIVMQQAMVSAAFVRAARPSAQRLLQTTTKESTIFALTQKVSITASGEAGVVIGRAEYAAANNNYLVRYKAADGRAQEAWWTEDALQAV